MSLPPKPPPITLPPPAPPLASVPTGSAPTTPTASKVANKRTVILTLLLYGGFVAAITSCVVLIGVLRWITGGSEPTPTRAELRATLLRQIDDYERTVYSKYAPRSKQNGDWRSFELKMEDWLPRHPEFAAYYGWYLEKNGYMAAIVDYRHPDLLREELDEYLAERR